MTDRIERITGKTLIVGIDIAKHIHWAQFTDSRGVPLRKPLKVETPSSALKNLLQKSLRWLPQRDLTMCSLDLNHLDITGEHWHGITRPPSK